MRITGRDGDLHDHWKGGASAYLGTVVPGFPIVFVLHGHLTETGRDTQNWPASTLTFRRRLRRFRLADFEGDAERPRSVA